MTDPSISLDAYRQLTRWAYSVVAALFGIVGIATAVFTTGLDVALLVAAVAATVLTCVSGARWPTSTRLRLLEIAAVVGVLGWGAAVWVGASPAVGFALFLPLAYAIATRRPWWPWALLTLMSLVAAPVVTAMAGRLDPARGIADQVAGLFFLGAEVIVFLAVELGWVIFARMDAHRASENELAITRERLRFANDLHDLQGHTLIAIKLKAELARRSLATGPDTTRRELADIERLVAEVSAQTRQIANGYRAVTLATELANAERLLTAAGMTTTIDPAPDGLGDLEPLVATTIREGISNILRHSAAEAVSIRLAPGIVTIVNDGPRPNDTTDPDSGNGLTSLRTRFAEHGGTLSWERSEGTFTLTAHLQNRRSRA